MTDYRDTIVAKAREAYANRKGVHHRFINVTDGVSRLTDRLVSDATFFTDIDEAAADAVEYSDYVGTVMVNADGTAVMLDLTAHGLALKEETVRNDGFEQDHNQELVGRWAD